MAGKNTHDADYDRWGSAPGSIKVIKPAKKKPVRKSGTGTGTKGKGTKK